MMISVCPNCGYERTGGCTSCNPNCPRCGIEMDRRDLVRHVQMKAMKKINDDSRIQSKGN